MTKKQKKVVHKKVTGSKLTFIYQNGDILILVESFKNFVFYGGKTGKKRRRVTSCLHELCLIYDYFF